MSLDRRSAPEMGLALEDIDDILDALCAAAEQRQLEPAWIPRLTDPDDEPLLQLAVEGQALYRHPQYTAFAARSGVWYRSSDTGRIPGQTESKHMTTIQAQVPDPLARQVAELAEQEKVSVDQLVSIALAYQVSAWRKRGTMAERAQRGSWEKFDRVMAKVRDVPPLPGDER